MHINCVMHKIRFVSKVHKLAGHDDCLKIYCSFHLSKLAFSKAIRIFPVCYKRKRREILLPGKDLGFFEQFKELPLAAPF